MKIEKLLDDYFVSETVDETRTYKKYIFPGNVEISVQMNRMMVGNCYADISVRFPPKIKEKLEPLISTHDNASFMYDKILYIYAKRKNDILWALLDILKIVTGQSELIDNMYKNWK